MLLLTRRRVLVEEEESAYLADCDADSDDTRALRPLQSGAWPCRPRRAYRIAFGPWSARFAAGSNSWKKSAWAI